YWYTHGLAKVIARTNVSPKEFVQNGKSAKAELPSMAGLPEIAPERSSGLKMSAQNMNLVETTVFNTYDSNVCYAYTEMIYASGSANAPKVINKYLATFTLPEEKNKILPLITKYKDKQSLRILEDFMKRGVFSRKMLLKKISEYHTDASTDVIKRTAENNLSPIKEEAKEIYNELINWDKVSTGDKVPAARRIAGLMNNPNTNQGDI
ncbi:MAG: hypothetical protein ACI352_01715, partial [Elusimicrobiaceae bacterium]